MNNNLFTDIAPHAILKCLLLIAMLCLAGCSTTLPKLTSGQPAVDGSTVCATEPDGVPPQNAPDDCLKEVCRNGRPESIEELTETASVHDWAEEGFCFFHPFDCFRALSVKHHVRQWEQDKVKAGLWDHASLQSGMGDAARHAYLACILTERFGSTFAKGLLDAHEEDSSVMFGFGNAAKGNRCCDKVMDRYNNRIGMELAAQPGNCEEKSLKSLGRLRHSLCAK
ncbi:MAG: hypothetical protein JJE30_13070 [Desulfuromonadales bacterium]|nr:hypothetical protein [Desulfuromonadales bacterium]